LLTLDTSAYTASLRADDDALYLLTSNAAHRVVPGQEPQSQPLDLSFGATLSELAIIFWSSGAVWSAPKRGGELQRLGMVPHQPQYFVASGARLAWIDRTEQGLFTLQTLERNKPRVFYSSPGKIDALSMSHDWVFFVERANDDTWRFGGLSTRGGNPAYTPSKRGRTPAMLAVSNDIYYYEPDAQELRSLSPDFQHEETIAKNVVCSPVAVAEKIYCAQVQGLFEVTKDTHRMTLLTRGSRRLITSIVANSKFVAWLSDVGPNKLALMTLPTHTDTNPTP
jgi:hypothetical protein